MLASYGMRETADLEFLSKLNYREIDYARGKLLEKKIIEVDSNKKLKLTKLGSKVKDLPMEFDESLICVSMPIICNDCNEKFIWRDRGRCPKCMSRNLNYVLRAHAIAGLCFSESFYHALRMQGNDRARLFKVKGEWKSTLKHAAMSDTYYVRPDYVNAKSSILTKANLLRQATKAQDQNNRLTTLPKFCNDNNLVQKKIKSYLYQFYNVCKSMGAYKTMQRSFVENGMDGELTNIFVKTIKDINTFPRISFMHCESEYNGYWCMMDSMEKEIMKISDQLYSIIGKVKTITNKKGNKFAVMSNMTIA